MKIILKAFLPVDLFCNQLDLEREKMSIESQPGDVSPIRVPFKEEKEIGDESPTRYMLPEVPVVEPEKKKRRKSAPRKKREKEKKPRKKKNVKTTTKVKVLEEGEIFDPDVFLMKAFSAGDPHCPIHTKEALIKRKTDRGWEYFFCPYMTGGNICFMCTGADNLDKYLSNIHKHLPAYWNMDKMTCF